MANFIPLCRAYLKRQVESVHTLMAVDAAETWITHTAEVAGWQADAAASRTTDVGGDVAHSS